MDQELALAILLSGRSALLTGAAGTGKTHLLNTFIAQARKRGKKVSEQRRQVWRQRTLGAIRFTAGVALV